MSRNISEIIGEDREKFFVRSKQSLRQAIEYMRAKNVGAVAVCDDKKVVGERYTAAGRTRGS